MDDIRKVKAAVVALRDQFQAMGNDMQASRRSMAAMSEAMQAMNQAMQANTAATERMEARLAGAVTTLCSLEESVDELGKSLATLAKKQDSQGHELRKLASRVKALEERAS